MLAILIVIICLHLLSFVWIYEIYCGDFFSEKNKNETIGAWFIPYIIRYLYEILFNYVAIVALCMLGVIPASPERYGTTAFRSMYIGVSAIGLYGVILFYFLHGEA